jgi:DNA-directed RNA polymerase specialized sigma24 family protein
LPKGRDPRGFPGPAGAQATISPGTGHSHPLDRMILRDNLRQIFAALTPAELVIALLRVDGWTDVEIAEALAISATAVTLTMDRAYERILNTQPRDVANLVRGRRRPRPKGPQSRSQGSEETPAA